MAETLLNITGLHRADVAGFSALSLCLNRGEILGLVGPSGSGKSLTLRAIADLDPADGSFRLDGKDREAISAPEWRRQVCYLPAESGWWATQVGDHFQFAKSTKSLFERLDLSSAALDWPVSRLSTGERQRLALIRAFENDPKVLLLDEPTAALDAKRRDMVEGLLQDFIGEGGAIILVSHDADQVERLVNRTITLGTQAPRSVA